MFSLRTASRLHLGLLSLPSSDERWPDRHGQPVLRARQYGGVGMMIDAPGLLVHAELASDWSAEGPLAERALAFAQQMFASIHDPSLPPCRLVINSAVREHVGLGVGTQLGLAVASLLSALWGRNDSVTDLAQHVGRGARSAIGVHGFAQGGFLVEAGKTIASSLSPLVARVGWPNDWPILVVVPSEPAGRHGAEERAAFERLAVAHTTTEALSRLVLLGLLPALIERDAQTFGEAVFDFNARVGELFAPVQGGTYASKSATGLIDYLRREGVPGVGQSSWGPTVFAFVRDADHAAYLSERVRALLPEAETWIAAGVNRGYTMERGV